MSNWQEVKIMVNRSALEGVYAILDNWGIESFAVEDSALINDAERLGWGDYFPEIVHSEQVVITCYFSDEYFDLGKIEQLKLDLEGLSQFGFEPGSVLVKLGEIDEADWADLWKKYYHPQRIGRILIQPSWENFEFKPKGIDLIVQLDPGMAFGSGTHPTTAMCIEVLQNLNLEERILWDVGTGSGILAIVAAKLGAKVQAVDIDPVAVKVARENRDLNQVSFPINKGSLQDLSGSPHVIVANIIADVIGPMMEKVSALLAPKGLFIAAGVIRERDQEMLTIAKSSGLRLLRHLEAGEWVGYLFQRGGGD